MRQATEEEDEEKEEKEDEAGRARTRETTKTCNISNSLSENNISARGSSFIGGAFHCSFTVHFEQHVHFPQEIIYFLLSEVKMS